MINLLPEPYEIIVHDAQNSFPNECCGFLFGTETGHQRNITHALVVNNAKEGDKKRRFEISARDYLHAERFASEQELTLLGIYHSHPLHPAIPSEHDRVAAQPFFSYVIVSVMPNGVAETLSWRLNEAQVFEPEPVNIPSLIQQ